MYEDIPVLTTTSRLDCPQICQLVCKGVLQSDEPEQRLVFFPNYRHFLVSKWMKIGIGTKGRRWGLVPKTESQCSS